MNRRRQTRSGARYSPPPRIPGLDFNDDQNFGDRNYNDRQPDNMQPKYSEPPAEKRLPLAIENVLALRTEITKQHGMELNFANEDSEQRNNLAAEVRAFDARVKAEYVNNDSANETTASAKADKKKRRKKKKKKSERRAAASKENQEGNKMPKEESVEGANVIIDYVPEEVNVNQLAPMYRQFAKIFAAFRITEPEIATNHKPEEPLNVLREMKMAQEMAQSYKKEPQDLKKVPKLPDDEDDYDEGSKGDEDKKEKMSKRKLKLLNRLSVAELKQLVTRPDVVEMHDVTARDPKLLVQLKAHRNTVPVPRHWCFKRKYLQGKRGIEKPPFELPDFIVRTGIMEMRGALQEKEDAKTLKSKMREKARPKMGKIDVDYQKLHDAFFKWQTKPKLSIHGDLYYEGKEFETKLKDTKPGELSDELRTALGMPVGPHAHRVPPPWLIAMQRYGPPPSYPNLKMPGLNAPIPEGCSYGYHAGGWGKPPVDEVGKPLYGDVFGTEIYVPKASIEVEVDKTIWGELESEEEDEESDEEGEEDEEGKEESKEEGSGLMTPCEGLITPSGLQSMPAGINTPDIIELRKRKIEAEIDGGITPALYQVLPERKTDKIGGAMMASTHVYDVNAGTVELALDPSELDLVDTDAMALRYEQQLREQQSLLQKDDLSDMVVDHVSRQKGKRKKPQAHENKPTKRYKEFKF